eukprot:scaffold69_cov248-Pinguiococcus_pyrenoidosus.AAC.31
MDYSTNRRAEATRDQQLRQRCFSSWAVSQWKESAAETSEKITLFSFSEKFRRQMEAEGEYQNQRSDFSMLAKSNARNNEVTREMLNYLRNGITEDNMGNYTKGVASVQIVRKAPSSSHGFFLVVAAIEHYKKLLKLSRRTENKDFLGLALNHLGVNFLYLVDTPKDITLRSPYSVREASTGGDLSQMSAEQQELVHKAIECFEEHRANADDAGEFIARTNLGICADILGDLDAAAQHHQEALRIAIRIQSVHAQAIAVGNLGILAQFQGDFTTALACMEQYLALVQTLKVRSLDLAQLLCTSQP